MTVIAGCDGRSQGRDAVVLGAALAAALNEPLLVASVHPATDLYISLPLQELRDQAQRTAEEGLADARDVQAIARAVPGRSTAHGLHDLAEREEASVLVVGSSHRGALGRVLAGNVAAQLLSGASCPVAVAPRGQSEREVALRMIGVAFDDSPESWNAVQRAAALAESAGARLRVIEALPPLAPPPIGPQETERMMEERRAHCELELGRAVESVSERLHAEGRLIDGDPVRVLETQAHDGLDLLVTGARGFGPLRRVVLGSVSAELVRLAPCPVLVVPRSVEFDPSAGGLAGSDELEGEGGAPMGGARP
jgi:nucleotide-binding universal stress UspA family protein